MKFVTNGFAPMYSDGQIKIKDCPEGTVVTDGEDEATARKMVAMVTAENQPVDFFPVTE